MHGIAARAVGRAEADDRLHRDQRGLARLRLGGRHRGVQGAAVMAVAALDMPAAGLEPCRDVLGEADRGRAVDGDAVVVIEHDQLAQAQMARQADRLLADALLQAAVAQHDPGAVIDQITAELSGQRAFRQRHANGGGQALAQGAGRGLDALGMAVFRMAGGDRAPLAEIPDLIQRHVLVPGQVQQAVEQHGRVPVRQHEAVTVGPVGIGRIELQVVAEQHGGGIGHAHRGAGMAAVGGVHGINGQRADAVRQSEVLRVQIGLGGDGGVFGGV